MNILHIDSSIQGDASASRQLSAAIADRLRRAHPDADYRHRDLIEAPTPHLTLDTVMAGDNDLLAEFLAADTVVIGAPLYNFTIPSQLKAWFDHVIVAGRTFQYGVEGPVGLVPDKRVIVAVARGGVYAEGSPYAPYEHAETLMRVLLGFIGVTRPEFVVAEGLKLGDEPRAAALAAASAQVEALAA
jgi:FMN-dependent NADH-azoreductase